MGEPSWVSLLQVLLPAGTTLGAFLLGKATKGAVNAALISTLVKDVSDIKARQLADMQTLAQHTTLHEGYGGTFRDIANQLRELNANVSRLIGKLESISKG